MAFCHLNTQTHIHKNFVQRKYRRVDALPNPRIEAQSFLWKPQLAAGTHDNRLSPFFSISDTEKIISYHLFTYCLEFSSERPQYPPVVNRDLKGGNAEEAPREVTIFHSVNADLAHVVIDKGKNHQVDAQLSPGVETFRSSLWEPQLIAHRTIVAPPSFLILSPMSSEIPQLINCGVNNLISGVLLN